jgi:hypothetical protein
MCVSAAFELAMYASDACANSTTAAACIAFCTHTEDQSTSQGDTSKPTQIDDSTDVAPAAVQLE